MGCCFDFAFTCYLLCWLVVAVLVYGFALAVCLLGLFAVVVGWWACCLSVLSLKGIVLVGLLFYCFVIWLVCWGCFVAFGYLVGLVKVVKGLVKVGGWGMVLKAK